jgi:protein-L-isoaspartate(D-aspartate) O-methyltransferase
LDYARADGERFFDAERNASLVKNAERYYRAMYGGAHKSWNLRDQHMFDTLETVLAFRSAPGREAKAVVWEHNSHVGNGAATEMGARGELNVGQLARERYGDSAFLLSLREPRMPVGRAPG